MNHRDGSVSGVVSLGFQEAKAKDPVNHDTLKTHEAWSLQGAWVVIKKILQYTLLFKKNVHSLLSWCPLQSYCLDPPLSPLASVKLPLKVKHQLFWVLLVGQN